MKSKKTSSPRAIKLNIVQANLDELLARTDWQTRKANDPISLPARFADPLDREVVALLASSLAFGNIKAVLRSAERVLEVLGDRPARTLQTLSFEELKAELPPAVHRLYSAYDVSTLLINAGRLQTEFGSIGAFFASKMHEAFAQSETELADGYPSFPWLREDERRFLCAASELADALRDKKIAHPNISEDRKGLAHLMPDVRKGSACKRLFLFLRWMIREDDGVDFGLWTIPAAHLLIPVDTHIHRIGLNLGLIKQKSANLKASVELTRALKTFDAEDPVRFDFALCHHGVSKDCPSHVDRRTCTPCALRTSCKHGRNLR